MPLRKHRQVLRERQRVPPELPQARRRNRDEAHLHVIQGDEHCLHRRGMAEQLQEIIHREPETRVHVIQRRAQRHNLALLLIPSLIPQLLVHVLLTPQADP